MSQVSQERVVRDIAAERERQDKQWGGPSHDDQHIEGMWLHVIGNFAHSAESLMTARGVIPPSRRAAYRKELVKIAATAVAAIEALDRKQATLGSEVAS